MLARHREKMGNYYSAGRCPRPPGGRQKKKKKGKKDQAVEALPAPVPAVSRSRRYPRMRASMAGIKTARPAIKGESDRPRKTRTSPPRRGRQDVRAQKLRRRYTPVWAVTIPSPLGRGEEMLPGGGVPSV